MVHLTYFGNSPRCPLSAHCGHSGWVQELASRGSWLVFTWHIAPALLLPEELPEAAKAPDVAYLAVSETLRHRHRGYNRKLSRPRCLDTAIHTEAATLRGVTNHQLLAAIRRDLGPADTGLPAFRANDVSYVLKLKNSILDK